jgi:DMSO/TMAO reductase YedYZ molybdopterin-dependent catalytic subunit
VAARDLIALVRPKVEAQHVIFHSYDGYTTNVARDVFEASDVMVACQWEGQPLTREHGGPVRIVIPRFYFWKSAKWVKRIEFSRDDKPGFWEVRGYHNVGDPWKEERYS